MQSDSVVLFPHAALSPSELGKTLSLFGSLKVFLPWHMEPAEALAEDLPADAVQIARPPAALDPGTSFRQAIADYLDWIRRHMDRSGLDRLKAGAGTGEEEPIWEIRRKIRKGEMPQPEAGGEKAFRWHMVLHLAREIEEQRNEADRILDVLRRVRSPLDGLTDDPDEMRSLFEDLPGFDWRPESGPDDVMPILRAWLGLFEAALEPGDLLLTLDRRFVDVLTGLWAEAAPAHITAPPVIRFPYPDLSSHPLNRIQELREEHLSGEKAGELRKILFGPAKASMVDSELLSRQAAELADFRPKGLRAGVVNLTSVYLPALPEFEEQPSDNHPPAELLGRPLIFLEDAP